MSTRLGSLVESLGGKLIGDPELVLSGIAPLDAAGAAHITFLSNTKLRQQAASSKAGAMILSAENHALLAASFGGSVVIAENPYAYFARAAQFFQSRNADPVLPGIHASAVIDASAQIAASAMIGPHVIIEAGAIIGEHCVIGAGCYIGRKAMLGEATVLHPNVSLLANCRIGLRGLVQSGAVIGGDGFGFANDGGTFGGAAMILGHLTIADHVHISSGSLVSRSIAQAGQYTGFYPLAKNADWEKTAAIVRNLDRMRDKMREMEKTIQTLTTKQNSSS
jgi:UDP-3-O-[3-hydroxymyristoyl] glucosamine N-acyltransferase